DDYARRVATVASAGGDSSEHAKAELDRLHRVLINRLDAAPNEAAREVIEQALEASAAARTQVGLEPVPDVVSPDDAAATPVSSPTATPAPSVAPFAAAQPVETPDASAGPAGDGEEPLEAIE